ncbi:unnamed protein product [Mycena citricolor]|uniref:Smr domain-containing protein n=1 Tax=Mycena citricolor TaxID=2018698 RepID=A0AAD2H3D8_9AGAR|nr:unnamed protein product [Mycena citricolor]
MDAIFDSFQKEFCPPLDSSLLAALLADIDYNPTPDEPSIDAQISALRSNLIELAAHADESTFESSAEMDAAFSCSDDTNSNRDFCTTTPPTISSGSPSDRISLTINTPLAFLQMVLPNVTRERLLSALSEQEEHEIDIDLDDDELAALAAFESAAQWETVEYRPKAAQQHVVRTAKQDGTSVIPSKRDNDTIDPWARLASLATHVSNHLPPHQPSFFLSFFHDPAKGSTPYEALVAALRSIRSTSSSSGEEEDAARVEALYTLVDILLPSYPSPYASLLSDTELALAASHGRADDALELVRVLRDLDQEGEMGRGVLYHSPVANEPQFFDSGSKPAPVVKRIASLPTGPPNPQPPPLDRGSSTTPAQAAKTRGWQAVPSRWKPHNIPNPSIPNAKRHKTQPFHVPTYSRDVNGVSSRQRGSNIDVYRLRMGENVRRRNENAERSSTGVVKVPWRSRGEAAGYYAERAREFGEMARRDSLDAARMIVDSSRHQRGGDMLDLHGVTVSEAVIIVNEVLSEGSWGADSPLKIITGRGAHSANSVSVLKPAVRRALEAEGWTVSSWDGGLIVRGRK